MKFKKIQKQDKQKIYELYAKQKTWGTEYSMVTLFHWLKDFNVEVAVGDDYVCYRLYMDGKLLYFPPLAPNRKRCSQLLDKLIDMGAKHFAEVTDATLAEFCKRNFNIKPNRDMAEYVYTADSLINLSGKPLHSKRNHIAQFKKNFQYSFVDYIYKYRQDIEALFDYWIDEKLNAFQELSDDEKLLKQIEKDEFIKSTTIEKNAILDILDNLEYYNCFADVLIVDDKIIGLAIGEVLPTKVGAVYFEKADTRYDGVYAMLNNLFATKHFQDVKLINRQEDLGDDGLRKAKLSYKPKYIYTKYVATHTLDNDEEFCSDIIELYKDSFPEDDDKTVDYFFDKVFAPNRLRSLRIKDKLASALHIVPKTLEYLSSTITLPYIVAFATSKEYQKQGYGRRLIEETLRCMKSHKQAFVALYPAVEGMYEKFGFEKVFNYTTLNTTQIDMSKLIRKESQDVGIIKDIFDKKTAQYQVKLSRDKNQVWLKMGAEHAVHLLYLNNELIGYEMMESDTQVSESCILCPNSIMDNDTSSKANFEIVGQPQGMARVLNLDSAFALINFKRKYKFKLTDCTFEDNNNVYELEGNKLKISVGFDFSLTERQLVSLFFGQDVQGIPKAFVEEFPKSVFVPDKY